MAVPPRVRRMVPWVVGLLLLATVPVLAALQPTLTATPQELFPDTVVVEATAEPGTELGGPDRSPRTFELTVQRVLRGSNETSIVAGDTLEATVNGQDVSPLLEAEGPVVLPLHGPFDGAGPAWLVRDVQEEDMWDPQRWAIDSAVETLVSSVPSVLLAGAAIWAYGGGRTLFQRPHVTGLLAALVLGLLLSSLVLRASGHQSPLLSSEADPHVGTVSAYGLGPLGGVLLLALSGLAAWRTQETPPGARSLLIVGLGLPVALAISVAWLWPSVRISNLLEPLEGWQFVLWTPPTALACGAAARWLPAHRRRSGTLFLLLAAAFALFWIDEAIIAFGLLAIVVPAVADLLDPEGTLRLSRTRASGRAWSPSTRLVAWVLGATVAPLLAASVARPASLEALAGTFGLWAVFVALAGAALWAHRRAGQERVHPAGPLAALALGLLLAGATANSAGQLNPLFDWDYDGPPAMGPLGIMLAFVLPWLSAWGARSGTPGSRTALVAGLGVPVGLAISTWWLWPPKLGPWIVDAFALFGSILLPLALVCAASARWMANKRARQGLAVALGLLLAFLFYKGFPYWAWVLVPATAVVVACIAELVGPAVGDGPVRSDPMGSGPRPGGEGEGL